MVTVIPQNIPFLLATRVGSAYLIPSTGCGRYGSFNARTSSALNVTDWPATQARPQALVRDDRAKLPQTDLSVEVVGEFPISVKLQDVTRLLGLRRASAGSFSCGYPPTEDRRLRAPPKDGGQSRGGSRC
jgi:hypothetical protein